MKISEALNILFKQPLVKTPSKIKAGFAHTATLKFQRVKTIQLLGIQFAEWILEDTFTTHVGRHFKDHCCD
jgi:hypothetical protein